MRNSKTRFQHTRYKIKIRILFYNTSKITFEFLQTYIIYSLSAKNV